MDEQRHERIREVVASIPPGRVASYGEVAARAGERSARLVGYVLRTDGADLPWHRVLRSDGRFAAPSSSEQRARLIEEGVEVLDGRVSRSYRWRDEEGPGGDTP